MRIFMVGQDFNGWPMVSNSHSEAGQHWKGHIIRGYCRGASRIRGRGTRFAMRGWGITPKGTFSGPFPATLRKGDRCFQEEDGP